CYSLVMEQQIEYAPTLREAQLCPEGKSSAQMAGFEKTYGHVSVTTPGVYLSRDVKIAGLLLAFSVAFAVFSSTALRPSVSRAARAVVMRVSPLQAISLLSVGLFAYLKPGIIDMPPMAAVMEGARNGVNLYYVSFLQGKLGA